MIAAPAPTSGPVRFARFALPPHRLGYCGRTDATTMSDYALGRDDPGLRELAETFDGAYPYLRLLAGSSGRRDPLDADVVEAYWIGNELLDHVSTHDFGRSIDDRFRRRAGADWHHVLDDIPRGVANHAYHVMNVMPWTGLLRGGVVDEPLGIIDRCRISWGTVIGTTDESTVLVRRTPLVWTGSRLDYGEPAVEALRTTVDTVVGDVVAIHWDWICERLSLRQLSWLRGVTDAQLSLLRAS